MSQASFANNPFMLMLQPEVVFDMMERSESLAQLSRHTCRPLDRVAPTSSTTAEGEEAETTDQSIDEQAGLSN